MIGVLTFLLILLSSASGGVAAAEESPSYAYHLRVVRVSGAAGAPGAALGWSSDDGEPVLLPDYEAWGTAEQLDGLARTLGGVSATPLTGFFIRSEDGGVLRFERPVYLDEEVLDLSFQAFPPTLPGDAHELVLKMELRNGGEDPLAEADLEVRTDRTVAIALPSPLESDWLVLAVTMLNQDAMEQQAETVGKIHLAGMDDVMNPRLITKVDPTYPEAARKNRLTGEVILQLIIDREGIPRAPVVLKMSPGCEELAASAVDAVLQWRYSPGTLNGEPVPVYFTVFVKFSLD